MSKDGDSLSLVDKQHVSNFETVVSSERPEGDSTLQRVDLKVLIGTSDRTDELTLDMKIQQVCKCM